MPGVEAHLERARLVTTRSVFRQDPSMPEERQSDYQSTSTTRIIGRKARALYDLGFDSSEAETEHETWSEMLDEAQPGHLIGKYRIIRKLGEGGFGAVWQAEQSGISKMVAIKLIKPGMDSRQVIARFETERQTLALMAHPNIAAVLDAGTTPHGHPFFVMELVHGISITKFCDTRRLNLHDRLRLFLHVCQAVHHAHQKAVLHRDLKPSNILVESIDGGPVPKIIDFGIAKALTPSAQPGDETASYATGAGAFLGTPPYMSPEQAGSRLDVDTRSDIYSLGAVLYEILTGRTHIPMDAFRGADVAKMVHSILETEPVRPSLLFVQPDDPERTRQWAEARDTDPGTLAQDLRGDLDWIVLKALEKDRNRRYESAAALADDIQRYLADEPVIARPPSRFYILQKLVRRNRAAFIAAALTTLALVTGITAATMGLVKADRALKLARDESEKTRQVLSFMSGLFVDSKLEPGAFRELIQTTNEKRLREMTEQAEADMRVSRILANGFRELDELQEAEALNRHALQRLRQLGRDGTSEAADCLFDIVWIRNRIAEESVAETPTEEDELLIQACLSIRKQAEPPQSDALIQAEVLTASLQRRLGHTNKAKELLQALSGRVLARRTQSSPVLGWVLREQALIALQERDFDRAATMLQQARSSLMRAAESTKAQIQTQADIARLLTSVYMASNNLTAAEEAAREESAFRQEWLGHEDPHVRIRLAEIIAKRGRSVDAETSLNEVINFCAQTPRWQGAKEDALRRLVETGESSRPANDAILLANASRLAVLFLQKADEDRLQNNIESAKRREKEAELILEAHMRAPTPHPSEMGNLFVVHAGLSARREDHVAAVADLDKALSYLPEDLTSRFTLAMVLLETGQTQRFEQERREFLRRLDSHGPESAGSVDLVSESFEQLFWTWRTALIRPGLDPQDLKRVNDSVTRVYYHGGLSEKQAEWLALLKGMADYRSGQHEDAATWLDIACQSNDRVILVQSRFFVAMNNTHLAPPDTQVPFVEGQTGFDELINPYRLTNTTLPFRDYLATKLTREEAMAMNPADGPPGARTRGPH